MAHRFINWKGLRNLFPQDNGKNLNTIFSGSGIEFDIKSSVVRECKFALMLPELMVTILRIRSNLSRSKWFKIQFCINLFGSK